MAKNVKGWQHQVWRGCKLKSSWAAGRHPNQRKQLGERLPATSTKTKYCVPYDPAMPLLRNENVWSTVFIAASFSRISEAEKQLRTVTALINGALVKQWNPTLLLCTRTWPHIINFKKSEEWQPQSSTVHYISFYIYSTMYSSKASKDQCIMLKVRVVASSGGSRAAGL